jgi:hypothetical protein
MQFNHHVRPPKRAQPDRKRHSKIKFTLRPKAGTLNNKFFGPKNQLQTAPPDVPSTDRDEPELPNQPEQIRTQTEV